VTRSVRRHTIEKLIQIDVLRTLDPLPGGIDSGVGAHGAHDGSGVHFDIAGTFDDLFECRSYISLPFREQAQRMRMAINTRAVLEPVLLRNRRSAPSVDEVALDFLALQMSTNPAFRRVASQVYGAGAVFVIHQFASVNDVCDLVLCVVVDFESLIRVLHAQKIDKLGPSVDQISSVQITSNNCSNGFHRGLLVATRVPQVFEKVEMG
jgi:hypothetical protein